MSPGEIEKVGEFETSERGLFLPTPGGRQPVANGVLDGRLGTSDKKTACATCGGKLIDCAGHFGYIKLVLPVFHIGYFKHVLTVLQCICKYCGRPLLQEEERRQFLRQFRRPGLEPNQSKALLKKVVERCKRPKTCALCGELNGPVRKATSSLKIIHDKFKEANATKKSAKESKQDRALAAAKDELQEAGRHNENLRAHVGKDGTRITESLNPIKVLGLFQRMTQDDCELLNLKGRPENLIMTSLPVPPVCIRPSVEMDGGAPSNEDDITMKLIQIIEVNNILQTGIEKGLAIMNLMENWDFLQTQCAMYINSELPGLQQPYQGGGGKPLRGFVQRLKGKTGRFRGNLSGKRVDFSGRTVISPDPHLAIDEVAVPEDVAKELTYPERVTDHNRVKLMRNVKNGNSKHPGANFIESREADGTVTRVFLRYGDREAYARSLKPGDVVERHLEDGDVVLFNRQPSLHKMSIMAHKVRVMRGRTFRFNTFACTPYNADFDGDEMNLHVPQTELARAEALELMGVEENLCTPKSGEMVIAATQDFLTCSYLLTNKDNFFDRRQFAQLCTFMFDGRVRVQLPAPAVLKPVELWTGKQVFTVLVRPNGEPQPGPASGAEGGPGPGPGSCRTISLELAEKFYSKEGEEMCAKDGYVKFHKGELLAGRLGKATLGSGSKTGLFACLLRQTSKRYTAGCMQRLSKLSAHYVGSRGFSIGIDDVTPTARLNRDKQAAVDSGYRACDRFIHQYQNGTQVLQPGSNAEETLESYVTGELNRIREEAGKVCLAELAPLNAPLIMAQCGAKGSPLNISQMIACVGQQVVGGQRIPNGFQDRSLPHFPENAKTPDAKGFVASSFYSGLSPTEFFFHTMGGREGLVDTAVKTAETGYMSRRLMKALEDLSCQYDDTVRNSSQHVVQLVYGDDGLDPVDMEGREGRPINFGWLQRDVQNEARAPGALGLLPRQVRGKAVAEAIREMFPVPDEWGGGEAGRGTFALQFVEDLRAFVEDRAAATERARAELGLPPDAHAPERRVAETIAAEYGFTEPQLRVFLQRCKERYERKRIEPGSAAGAVGAQSIGEPGTQMTLKTFHFAGVAAMNATLGVPRIKEIINASKTISTPIMKVDLENDADVISARIVKGRLEKTLLGEVAEHIRIRIQPKFGQHEIVVKLDADAIQALQLDIDANVVGARIMASPLASKLKLRDRQFLIRREGQMELSITLEADDDKKDKDKSKEDAYTHLLTQLTQFRTLLPQVIISGIPSVGRAIINDTGAGRYELLVEGNDLQAVMGTDGVKGHSTSSNHVMEVEKTLGIEAARQCIMDEIHETMGAHGMHIDMRHIALLADVMTYKGEVLGITRFGIAKMKDSVLMLASFEKTTDHLFDAAVHGRRDAVEGVSECIIMGMPMPIGTGLFQLRHGYGVARPARAGLAEFDYDTC